MMKFTEYSIATILVSLVFISCAERFSKEEVLGTYTAEEYTHSFDTIVLQRNNRYHRKVYNIEKELLLDMEATYEFDGNNRIDLSSFYVNLDDNLIKFPNQVSDTTSLTSIILKEHNGTIAFCLGSIFGKREFDYCYNKIE
jgi:hypothetical protein